MSAGKAAAVLDVATRAEPEALSLVAYPALGEWAPMALVPAPVSRSWAAPVQRELMKRCLPLVLANQAGWLVHPGFGVAAVWNGDDDPSGIELEFDGGRPPYPVMSHFGNGILTWIVPYLFRTPPGYDLLARGPSNWPKDGIAPLEGLVETDWSVAPFTMNWKLTRPGLRATFDADEPVCMIVPQRRRELERFRPVVRDLASDPDTARRHATWVESRESFLEERRERDSGGISWQKHYFRGVTLDGLRAPDHQLKLRLRPFGGGARSAEEP